MEIGTVTSLAMSLLRTSASAYCCFFLSLSHLYVIFDISFFRKVMEVTKVGGEQKNTSELIGILFHYLHLRRW